MKTVYIYFLVKVAKSAKERKKERSRESCRVTGWPTKVDSVDSVALFAREKRRMTASNAIIIISSSLPLSLFQAYSQHSSQEKKKTIFHPISLQKKESCIKLLGSVHSSLFLGLVGFSL